MPDVFAVCDRVMVLRRGNKVADKPIANTSPEEVTSLITGAIAAAGSPKPTPATPASTPPSPPPRLPKR